MARKLTFVLFLLALMVFTFSPGKELRLDTIVGSVVASGEGQLLTSDAAPVSADELSAPRYTPVPTPSPTPQPSPTPTPTPSPTPLPTPEPTPSPTPMIKGMRSTEVEQLQQELIALGFLEGKADGQFGNATVNAIVNLKTYLNDQAIKSGQVQADANGNPAVLPYLVNGEADWQLMEALRDDVVGDTYEVLSEGDTGSAVKRVQSRLNTLQYLYQGVDGAFGKSTQEAITYFQKVNGLPQSGIADVNTQRALFSTSALLSDKPVHEYKVVVDVSEQRVYVYQWKDNAYSKLVKKMKCSTGTRSNPTPHGTYTDTVRRGERWHYFKDFGCWAQYAIHVDPTGNIMFHSVLFSSRGSSRPTSGSVYALGRRASHGCIRLAVDNAKWLHSTITDGTTVVIRN